MYKCVTLAFAFTMIVCAGCISSGAKVSQSLEGVTTGDGWIVGSIGAAKGLLFQRKGSVYNDHKLIFIKSGVKNAGGTLTYSPGEVFGLDKDFNDSDEGADLFAIQLPKGSYAFVGAYFWQNRGTGGTSEVRAPFSAPIPFEVKPGETLYLGSLIANNEWPDGFPLRTNPGYPFFTFNARSERDLPKLRAKFPALPTKVTVWAPLGFSIYLRTPEPR